MTWEEFVDPDRPRLPHRQWLRLMRRFEAEHQERQREQAEAAEAERTRRFFDRHLPQLREALNEENRARFDEMDRELQEAVWCEMHEQGLIFLRFTRHDATA